MRYQKPPLIPTKLRPVDIVGSHNMRMLQDHFALSLDHGGDFPSSRLNKEFTPEARSGIADVLNALRNNGYVPTGIGANGIEWGVVTKSDMQIEFEKNFDKLEKLPREDLQQLARSGYVEIRNAMGGFKNRDRAPSKQDTELEKLL